MQDLSVDERLASLERKIDVCLILLGTLTTAEGFKYDLTNKAPLWLRAMTLAEEQVSSVAIAAAKLHPECADERLSKWIDQVALASSEREEQQEIPSSLVRVEASTESQCNHSPSENSPDRGVRRVPNRG